MKETDKLLVTAYASFVVDRDTLGIVEYNDYGNRILKNHDHYGESVRISDIISWDASLVHKMQENKDKKVISRSSLNYDSSEIVVILQHMEFNDRAFYNVTLIDNLEDIDSLESRSIDMEIQGNGLFSNIFKYSPIGLVLVDNDSMLYKANKYMFDCFGLKYKEVIGNRFGNVFRCSTVTNDNLLCGMAEGCQSCKLRNGVNSVLVDNMTLEGVEIGHDFEVGGRTVRKWFTISASPVSYGSETYALVSFVDITQRVRMEQRLRELGITDGLTKLYNRRHIMNLLMDSLSNDDGHKHLSLALIDIDDFKMVNDVYGHLMGDDVLIMLSDLLKTHIRFSDYAGRYGGEEFLAIFVDTTASEADSILMRIMDEFRKSSKELVGKAITFSCGLMEVELGENVDETDTTLVLKRTDQLLYGAKAAGKDCVKAGSYTSKD